MSRFTDPGSWVSMLDELPTSPRAIAAVASAQTIHHNLLPHLGVPRERWPSLPRVWPPRIDLILRALREVPPHRLSEARAPEQRLVGGCVLESYLLAALLRRRGHRVRIRVGYFKNIRGNPEHVVAFWERVMREKRVQAELLEQNPGLWRETVNAYSQRQNELDHRIEHWICELWDEGARAWRLLDANTEFLRAHSGLEVDVFLPRERFEHAHEAWLRIRAGECDPDRYREDEQDGLSHARSQLLSDFAALLNHDGVGLDDGQGGDAAFIRRRYEETPAAELAALDELAKLLADGAIDRLPDLYRATPALRLEGLERDPYSLVSRATGNASS